MGLDPCITRLCHRRLYTLVPGQQTTRIHGIRTKPVVKGRPLDIGYDSIQVGGRLTLPIAEKLLIRSLKFSQEITYFLGWWRQRDGAKVCVPVRKKAASLNGRIAQSSADLQIHIFTLI
eukprot:767880-Hanusia_phi.AAC.2